ncbi:hypothetical protein T265_11782 [Opisthorchis viverrini]|uniref:Uncharacterized protein n=2 Tax=Opisthorchis viverrini TaxID=6198 RepID=A0A074Z886_OPIVI|nr:hypothetical protein T265_11782 [Opisthorchis viverrini]KER19450.1 hypothetical protein T265_11782 [Opisthorchis viverrini]
MSDHSSSPVTRSRRPKRLPAKTCDDNVLGISWKEERELRKAMYVSLRQKNKPSNGPQLRSRKILHRQASRKHSSTGENGFKVSAVSLRNPVRGREALAKRIAQGELRAAKLRATSRLRSDSTHVGSRSTRANGFHNNKGGLKTENETNFTDIASKYQEPTCSKRPHVNQHKTISVLNVARSIVRARLNGHGSKMLHRPAPHCGPSVVTAASKRPTLMSASNDAKVTSTHYKRPLTPKRSRLRSPIKFAPSAARTNDRNRKSGLPRSERHSVSQPVVTTKSPLKRGTDSSELDAVRPERRLFGSPDAPVCVPVKRTSDIIPRELCQDPEGRPVSVHDFVEFICYHGTPCLDPKLEWFDQTRRRSTASNSPKLPFWGCRSGSNSCPGDDLKTFQRGDSVSTAGSVTQACPSRSAKSEDHLISSPQSRLFSISSKICVAKKLASAHPHDVCIRSPILEIPSEIPSISSKPEDIDLLIPQSTIALPRKPSRNTRGLCVTRNSTGTSRRSRNRH